MTDVTEIVKRARALAAAGQAEAALALTAPLAEASGASADVLSAHAATLKALGRVADALPFNRRQTERDPAGRIGWYNYAATLGDLGRYAESEAAVRRTLALGLDRAEAHLVLARALAGLQRLDEAEQAFDAALLRDPLNVPAHRDLAQLVWMRTGDVRKALRRLEASLTGGPADIGLLRTKATVQQFADDLPGGIATLETAIGRQAHPALLLDLAGLKLDIGAGEQALDLARRTLAAAPGLKAARELCGQACLVAGDPAEAARIAEQILSSAPHDQMGLLILGTAWRMMGDPRAEALTAPERFVKPHRLPTPEGWTDLPAFLGDLSLSLRRLHGFKAHPLQQSLRGGSQAQGLLASEDPVIQAFFRSVDRVIADHAVWLGPGDDPVRSRITGRHRINAAWSVLLRPNGFHVNHFHPEGWLSSAFYVETPADAVDAGGHAGWLKFGEPGFPTRPMLAAQHFVRPEPGLLALFPSYMWHGTEAFTTEESRMTIAFDIVPA